MVTFVIFWSALFTIIFFLLGLIFRTLESAIEALLSSLYEILIIGGITGLVIFAVYMLSILCIGIFEFIGAIGIILLVVGLLSTVGTLVLELFVAIIAIVFGVLCAVSTFLGSIAEFCEKKYAKYLGIIMKQLDKI